MKSDLIPRICSFVPHLIAWKAIVKARLSSSCLNLQPEQQQYIDMEYTPLILLKGVAGSGKTTVGIYRAIRLAEQGRHVLMLTFSKTLSSITTSLIEELIGPLPDNLEVRTLHSIIVELLGSRLNLAKKGEPPPQKYLRDALAEVRQTGNAAVLKRSEKFFEEEIKRVIKGFGLKDVQEYKSIERYGRKTALAPGQREAVWRVYEAYQRRLAQAKYHDWSDAALLMLQEQPCSKRYDDIIVDEAQDLTPVDLRVIQQLIALSGNSPFGLKSLMNSWRCCSDTLTREDFHGNRLVFRPEDIPRSYERIIANTRQIIEAAAQLLNQNTLMRGLSEYIEPEWTLRYGHLLSCYRPKVGLTRPLIIFIKLSLCETTFWIWSVTRLFGSLILQSYAVPMSFVSSVNLC